MVLDDSNEYLLTSRLEPLVRRHALVSIAGLVDALPKAPRGSLETSVIDAMTTNETSLAGRFTQLEVSRGLPVRQRIRHFQQDGTEWVASRLLRQMMDVRVLNLLGSWAAVPKCDIVFLRNVLTYFHPKTKRTILERIRREALRPGGHLFLGSSETTINIDDGWTRRTLGRSISYASATTVGAIAVSRSPE